MTRPCLDMNPGDDWVFDLRRASKSGGHASNKVPVPAVVIPQMDGADTEDDGDTDDDDTVQSKGPDGRTGGGEGGAAVEASVNRGRGRPRKDGVPSGKGGSKRRRGTPAAAATAAGVLTGGAPRAVPPGQGGGDAPGAAPGTRAGGSWLEADAAAAATPQHGAAQRESEALGAGAGVSAGPVKRRGRPPSAATSAVGAAKARVLRLFLERFHGLRAQLPPDEVVEYGAWQRMSDADTRLLQARPARPARTVAAGHAPCAESGWGRAMPRACEGRRVLRQCAGRRRRATRWWRHTRMNARRPVRGGARAPQPRRRSARERGVGGGQG